MTSLYWSAPQKKTALIKTALISIGIASTVTLLIYFLKIVQSAFKAVPNTRAGMNSILRM
jgi:hypothetical protein